VVVRGSGFDVVVMWCEEGLMAAIKVKKKKKNENNREAG
jgi:hypothetical protein